MMQDIASMGIRLLQTPEYVLPPHRTGGSDTVPPANTTTPNTTEQYYEEGAQSIYEFVAYVSWYLVVILCCVVPTVCAYRRRRVLERRAARQNYLQTMAENGLLFMAASNQPESEEMQKARMAKIEAEIAKTTMVSHNHETLVYVCACVRTGYPLLLLLWRWRCSQANESLSLLPLLFLMSFFSSLIGRR